MSKEGKETGVDRGGNREFGEVGGYRWRFREGREYEEWCWRISRAKWEHLDRTTYCSKVSVQSKRRTNENVGRGGEYDGKGREWVRMGEAVRDWA